MNALNSKRKKNFLKKNIEGNSSIYPRIISPNIPPKLINNYNESNTMANFNKFNFSKISKQALGLVMKDNKIRHKSNAGTRKFYVNNNNNLTRNLIDNQLNFYDNKTLNDISSYNSLIKIWNDFYVMETYKNLFNMILNKLNEEEKEDLCIKELKELTELKSNINSLKKEIQSRKKTLENLNILNIKLGEAVMKDGNNIDEDIINNISDEIKNLRLYTVNICHKMKKVKNKIYEGYLYGKYSLDTISQRFGFDKNYLIKMKEEMNFLKEGYIRHFFNINNDFSPFLMKASEKNNNSNGEQYIHIVPISKELKDNINLCNYLIYQELIYYQNNKINNRFDRVLSPCKNNSKILNYNLKAINQYDENIDFQNNKNVNNYFNFRNEKEDNNLDNPRLFNEQKYNLEMNEKNKNIQDESILFEEKGINIKDILGDTNTKINNPNINKNNNNIIKKEIKAFSKNLEKFSESQTSKKSDLRSNNSNKKSNSSICRYSYKYFKVIIFNNYINYFNDNYYKEYYKKIPEQEISMFNLQNDILPSLLNGIAPFLLLVKDENDNIYGLCSFNYIYFKNKLKIKINHISAFVDFNDNDYVGNLKIIYGNIINYLKQHFYFDEIFFEFMKNKKNDEIYNIFINKFGFAEKAISIKKNQNESNGGDEISNNDNNKLNFLVYKNRLIINDTIKESITSFLGKNIFHFFDSILLTNKDKVSNQNNMTGNNLMKSKSLGTLSDINDLKYSDSDLFINIVAINNLFQSKNNKKVVNVYQSINSLEKLIKIFLQNNINNDEIPLSVAENRFDIISFIFNKIINDISKNTSKLINNYNIYNSNSFLDEKTGISYNFMKPEKIYILYDEKNEINFYIVVNNSFAVFFIQFNSNEIKRYIFKQNLYLQIDEIYKELISNKMIDVLDNKIIWIPCFNVYRHFKCLINKSYFTVHEYIRISNKNINSNTKKKKEFNKSYGLLFNKNLNSFLIEPQINNDIFIDNDFIIGIINNASFFNKLMSNKNEASSIIKDKEKEIPANYSIKSEDEKEKNNEFNNNKSENSKKTNQKMKSDINSSDFPNIVFLNYISKNDFIINNNEYI